MWQEILVGIIVVAAVAALLWRYLPARWRARVARIHPALAAAGHSGGGCGSGCGGCSGSSSCAASRK